MKPVAVRGVRAARDGRHNGGIMWYLGMIVSATAMLMASRMVEAAEPKIGYVDLNRALIMSNEGKKARERFIAEMDRLQAKLRSEKEDLDKEREEFERKAMLLRDKERVGIEQKFEDRQLAFRRKSEDYQRDLKRLDSQYTGAILKGLEGTIGEIGADGGYTIIFEVQSSGIVYGDPSADLTEELIERYNATGGKGSKGGKKD